MVLRALSQASHPPCYLQRAGNSPGPSGPWEVALAFRLPGSSLLGPGGISELSAGDPSS